MSGSPGKSVRGSQGTTATGSPSSSASGSQGTTATGLPSSSVRGSQGTTSTGPQHPNLRGSQGSSMRGEQKSSASGSRGTTATGPQHPNLRGSQRSSASGDPNTMTGGPRNTKTGAQASPVRAVLDSFEGGAATVSGIALDTGLSVDLVQAVMDQLVRMGKLRATPMSYGCPTGDSSCGSCSLTSEDGSSCASDSGSSRGPVLIELNTQALRR